MHNYKPLNTPLIVNDKLRLNDVSSKYKLLCIES